jgi:CRISPR-associated (Cas) DxTHG family
MATYIITFLGISPLNAEYDFDGRKIVAQVFPQALRAVVEFDRMYVCVTALAKQRTFPILAQLNDDRIEAVDIEDGEDTSQMWQNFNTIVSKFQSGDRVIFDITHAARSIPFLTFLFSAYLKVAKQVEIVEVYYGALVFASPSPSTSQSELPPKLATVIKMGGFVSMLDWMSATERFIDLGDGNKLVELLADLTGQIQDPILKMTVQKTAKAIERVSDALIYIRPMEVMESVAELQELIPIVNAQGQSLPQLQPFLLLSEQIINLYQNLALARASEPANLQENLRRQLAMIGWYQNNQHQVRSIMLGRELFVSTLMYWQGERSIFDYKIRKPAENILNGQKNREFDSFGDSQKIKQTWKKATELRNDFAHTGMSSAPESIDSLKQKIDGVIEEIKTCLEEFLAAAIDRPPSLSTTTMATARPKPRSKPQRL